MHKPAQIDIGGIRCRSVFPLFPYLCIKKAPFSSGLLKGSDLSHPFFHPDYTVDSGIAPDQLALVDYHHRSGIGCIGNLTLPQRKNIIFCFFILPFFCDQSIFIPKSGDRLRVCSDKMNLIMRIFRKIL